MLENSQWSEKEYREREERIDRWLGIARKAGDELTVAGLAGIRANLLRHRGLQEKNPGLLISSFEATHEFRSRFGIIDEQVRKGDLIIGAPLVAGLLELEVSLALACADLKYMEKLVREIRDAELWCRRGDLEHCEAKKNWRRDIVSVLEYGISSWEKTETEKVVHMDDSDEFILKIWRHALWVRKNGAELAGKEPLCPNRPQGIAEGKDDRGNNEINKRTNSLQKIQRMSGCMMPKRMLTLAPNLPSSVGQMEKWRKEVRT